MLLPAVIENIKASPLLLLFYAFAIYWGYTHSFVQIDRQKLRRLLAAQNPAPAGPLVNDALKLRFNPPQGWLTIPADPAHGTLGIYRSPETEGAATAIMVLMNDFLKADQTLDDFVGETAKDLRAKPVGIEILENAARPFPNGKAVRLVYHATKDDPPYKAQMHIFNKDNRIAALLGRVDRNDYAKFSSAFETAANSLQMGD